MSLLSDLSHFFRSNLPFVLVPPAGLIWWLLIGLVIMRRHRRFGIAVASTPGAGTVFTVRLPRTAPRHDETAA